MRAFHSNSTIPSVSYLGRGRNGHGYFLEDFEILTTMLSALKWRQHNGSIRMYTDSAGADYYDRLGLSALWDDGINTEVIDHCGWEISHNVFWTFGRVAALQHEDTPVVALDTDLIVWRGISQSLSADLVMLHSEPWFDVYLPKEELSTPADYRWKEWNWETLPHNAAFMYLGREDVKELFVNEAALFMHNNPIVGEDFETVPAHDAFVAQRLLPMCAEKLGARCTDLLDWQFGSEAPERLLNGDRNDVITHVWAYKSAIKNHDSLRVEFCTRCIKRLIHDFPDYEGIVHKIPSLRRYFTLQYA